jgi:hypothetical protein
MTGFVAHSHRSNEPDSRHRGSLHRYSDDRMIEVSARMKANCSPFTCFTEGKVFDMCRYPTL